MTEKNFFEPEEFADDKLRVEIPPEVGLPKGDRVPNSDDPMGRIYLEGRAYGSLGKGNLHWWVLIPAWFIFGLIGFAVLAMLLDTIKNSSIGKLNYSDIWIYLLLIIVIMVFGAILYGLFRETKAKLVRKSRNR